jgi:hypothetical protein
MMHGNESLTKNFNALKKWGENISSLEKLYKENESQFLKIMKWDGVGKLQIKFLNLEKERTFHFYYFEVIIKHQNSSTIDQNKLSGNRLKLINLDIDGRPLHSRYNPLKEGLYIEKSDSTLVLLGCGLGYNLDNYLPNTQNTIIIIEPNPILILLLLFFRDLGEFIINGQLRLMWKITEENVYRNIKNLENINYNFIPHRGCFGAFSQDTYLSEKKIFWSFVEKKGVNITTLSRFEKIWARNLITNLRHSLNIAHPLNIVLGKHKKKPLSDFYNEAILICAGPSLMIDSFDFLLWLKELHDKKKTPLIIAVDTALMPLYGIGMDPDIIFCVDPQPVNRYYLHGYKGKALLITDPSCDPNTIKLIPYASKQLLFADSNFPIYKILVEKEKGALAFGGSVSTNAIDFLIRCNLRRIYILGQDLAYLHKIAHTPGASIEEMHKRKVKRIHSFENYNYKQISSIPIRYAVNYKEQKIPTNDKLLIFRDWFEQKQKEFINTENENKLYIVGMQGLKINNIPAISYDEAREMILSDIEDSGDLSTNDIKLKTGISDYYFQKAPVPEKINYHSLLSIIDELKEYRKWLKLGLAYSNEIYKILDISIESNKATPNINLPNINQSKKLKDLLKKMEEIDEIISEKQGLSSLISITIQRIIFQITEGYNEKLSEKEKEHWELKVAKKSLNLYEGLLEGVNFNIGLLKKIIL